jgi:hypothetical protein
MPENLMDLDRRHFDFDFEDDYNKRRLLDACAFVILLLILSLILPSISIKELFSTLFLRQKIEFISNSMKLKRRGLSKK